MRPLALLVFTFAALAAQACAQGNGPSASSDATSGSGSGGAGTTATTSNASSGGAGGGLVEDCATAFPTVPVCQVAAWDAAQGKCLLAPMQDGTPCSDGDDCTVGDMCVTGACVKGPDAPSPLSCQMGLATIASMPPGTTTLTFDTCEGGCACCGPGGTYPQGVTVDCATCSIDASLAAHGITRKGGSGTVFVDCITGNAAAPLAKEALFAEGGTIELTFAQGVKVFGFAALPSSSASTPTVTLEGYSSDGLLVGTDAFTFTTPGGDCTTSNPAAQFFGFRACCGTIARVVATFSQWDTAIDAISFW